MNNTETQQKPYTQVVNSLLNDMSISLKAKGLYAFMDSKPSGWNFTIRSMSRQLKEGVLSIQNGLQELKEVGYINYTKKINGSGIYTLTDGMAANIENQYIDNRKLRKPIRISNKEPIVKKIVSKVPTLEEVFKYSIEKNMDVDVNFFYEYYSANDWVDANGNKVKSWKQKLITWNNRHKKQKKENEKVQLWG